MITKVLYLNDEQKPMTVRILDDSYDPALGKSTKQDYFQLAPAEGKVFELSIPEGSILWIKKWPNLVMLSYVQGSVIENQVRDE